MIWLEEAVAPPAPAGCRRPRAAAGPAAHQVSSHHRRLEPQRMADPSAQSLLILAREGNMSPISKHSLRLLIAIFSAALAAGCATSGKRAEEEAANAKRARSHYDIGVDHVSNGRIEMGLREFLAATALAPRNAQYQHALGLAYLQKEHYQRGRAAPAQARSRSRPTTTTRASTSPGCCSGAARCEEARVEAERLYSDPTFPGPWRALSNRGWAEYKLGRVEEARATFALDAEVQPGLLARAAQPRHPRIRAGPPSGGDPALRGGARAAAGAGRRGRGQLPTGRDLRLARQAEPRRRVPDGRGREGAERSMGQEVRGSPEAAALSDAEPADAIDRQLSRAAAPPARNLGRRPGAAGRASRAARSSGWRPAPSTARPTASCAASCEPWPRRSGWIPTTP